MLPGERTVTVVDRNGMPVWWPNIFHANELRDAGHSYSHQKRTMSAVITAFNWTFERGIDLEAGRLGTAPLADDESDQLDAKPKADRRDRRILQLEQHNAALRAEVRGLREQLARYRHVEEAMITGRGVRDG